MHSLHAPPSHQGHQPGRAQISLAVDRRQRGIPAESSYTSKTRGGMQRRRVGKQDSRGGRAAAALSGRSRDVVARACRHRHAQPQVVLGVFGRGEGGRGALSSGLAPKARRSKRAAPKNSPLRATSPHKERGASRCIEVHRGAVRPPRSDAVERLGVAQRCCICPVPDWERAAAPAMRLSAHEADCDGAAAPPAPERPAASGTAEKQP